MILMFSEAALTAAMNECDDDEEDGENIDRVVLDMSVLCTCWACTMKLFAFCLILSPASTKNYVLLYTTMVDI